MRESALDLGELLGDSKEGKDESIRELLIQLKNHINLYGKKI